MRYKISHSPPAERVARQNRIATQRKQIFSAQEIFLRRIAAVATLRPAVNAYGSALKKVGFRLYVPLRIVIIYGADKAR